MQTIIENNVLGSKRQNLSRWRVIDIVIAAVVGVAFGVVYWAWGLAWNPLEVLFAFLPGASGLLTGVWFLAGVLAAIIVRKPGAALFAETLAALVSVLIGSQWSTDTIIAGIVQGLAVELVFLCVRYRIWNSFVTILAGASAGLFGALLTVAMYYPKNDATFKIINITSTVISGAVISGVFALILLRALVKTGVLSRFPVSADADIALRDNH